MRGGTLGIRIRGGGGEGVESDMVLLEDLHRSSGHGDA
jgi:hypothetical protein